MEHSGQPGGLDWEGAWNLARASHTAGLLVRLRNRSGACREVLRALESGDAEIRKRAADVARRITEKDRDFLCPIADELAWMLSITPLGENRTRWHLGLVVARLAKTPDQVTVAAELMWRLAEDESNVVRCSAIEGLGELALRSPALRDPVEVYLQEAVRTGTAAMKCRARYAIRKLDRSLSGRARR